VYDAALDDRPSRRRRCEESPVSEAHPATRPDPLHVLSAAAEALARDADLDDALGTLLGTAAAAVGARAGAVYVQDPDRSALEPLLAVGIDDAGLASLTAGLDDPDDPVPTTAREHAGAARSGDWSGGFGRASGCGFAVFRPLVATRAGIDLSGGVLALGWDELHELGPDEDELLGAIADLAAVAIDRARLASLVTERADWFERIAHSDPLTGLANQRTFARVLELELARAGRQASEVSVALIDVDDFEATNERAGHEAGDDVLRAVAAAISQSVRLVDTVARSGADEFVIVAPGSAGMTVARRVADAVTALPSEASGRVSISIGVSRFPVDGASADELMAAARQALDRARSTGTGTIVEASPQPAA
jgi:diguanylate cyclase (GGDEF)-like protein